MRTKIIATLGLHSSTTPILKGMIAAGLDIARINCSHAKPDEIRARVKLVRRIAKQMHRRVDVLLDLQGPRLRVNNVPPEGRILTPGEMVIFDTKPTARPGVLHIDDPYLHLDIKAGHPLYLANGEFKVMVKKVFETSIHARVIRGGRLLNRKGINVPQTPLTTSGLTPKDINDLKVGLAADVDYVAMSFVQSAADIKALRKLVGRRAKLVAKIEMAVALKHLTAILRASDAIMVARGDLGIEVLHEEVPFLQKKMIKIARRHRRPAIVATQMMMSMVNAKHPTRAEVSDVANAVLDGATHVMLSDETAAGKYPVETVAAMRRIVRRAER